MKRVHYNESKSQRFFSGKGFYIALAISLAAVGGAAWIGVNSAMGELNEQQTPELTKIPQKIESESEWSLPSEAQVEAKQENVKAETSSAEPVKETNTAVAQGFILPLKGDVLNGYSGDKVVKSKTLDDWVMHTGMDIAAAVSTPVKAMSGGKVIEVKNDNLWGTCVTIQHEKGLESYYANLKSAVNVKVNQTVKMGDVIGAVGETCDIERAEESHLHFGVKQSGEWVDPFSVIK